MALNPRRHDNVRRRSHTTYLVWVAVAMLAALAAVALPHASTVHASFADRNAAIARGATAIDGAPLGALPRECNPDPAETMDDDLREGDRIDPASVDGTGGGKPAPRFGKRRRILRQDTCTPGVQQQRQAAHRAARQRRVPAVSRRQRRTIRRSSRGTGDRADGPQPCKGSSSARTGADDIGTVAPFLPDHTLTRTTSSGGCRGHPPGS